MTAALVVVMLAVAGAVLDRVSARLVERRAAAYLSGSLDGPARVLVRAAPFCIQAVRGRYGSVEVTGAGVRVGELAGVELSAQLTNVLLPVPMLLGRRTFELRCERVDSEVVIPYPQLARAARVPTLALRYERDRLMASLSLPVPGFSQLGRVSGEALLSVGDGGSVWLRVGGLAVAGITVPRFVLDQLLSSLTLPIPMPKLPYGLQLVALTPGPAGLSATVSGREVRSGSVGNPSE